MERRQALLARDISWGVLGGTWGKCWEYTQGETGGRWEAGGPTVCTLGRQVKLWGRWRILGTGFGGAWGEARWDSAAVRQGGNGPGGLNTIQLRRSRRTEVWACLQVAVPPQQNTVHALAGGVGATHLLARAAVGGRGPGHRHLRPHRDESDGLGRGGGGQYVVRTRRVHSWARRRRRNWWMLLLLLACSLLRHSRRGAGVGQSSHGVGEEGG